MRGVEAEYEGRIEFARVNILQPESEALMEQYGFNATPELYLVDGQGRVIYFWDAAVSADELRQAFDEALATEAPP